LHDYHCNVMQPEKPKITMNVSIDLSQTQVHNQNEVVTHKNNVVMNSHSIILIDQN
jgi:hypothetical protein